MAYLVLARKYRPKQFAELVGQSHVANTMLNAFKQEKVGQAYLFTGTRGVGKTSAARIFAKALRCEAVQTNNRGVPCERCASCQEINQGSAIDVLEIDGASNNGVDNVREIRENVKFLPSKGKTKVYIIDEVHMLTGAAFNALLKTLEEPPPHIVFILATTDVQKIPATILSRCQRFDFRRVPQPVIYDYLMQLVAKENIEAEPAAIRLVARKAEGSIRDSLSLLDQVMALAGDKITQSKATEILGVVDGTFLAKLLSTVYQNKILEALAMLEQAFTAGIEMKQIALDLAESARNALLIKLDAKSTLTEITDDERKALEECVSHTSVEALQASFRLLSQSLEEIARSPIPRASLEMLLVRLASLGRLASLEEILRGAVAASATTSPQQSGAFSAQSVTAALASPVSTSSSSSETKAVSANQDGQNSWQNFVHYVSKEKPSIGALLEHAVPVTPSEQWKNAVVITLGFREQQNFYREQLQVKANLQNLEALVAKYLGVKKVALRLEEVRVEAHNASMADRNEAAERDVTEKAKSQFLEQDIIKKTQEIFGAKLSGFDLNKSKN